MNCNLAYLLKKQKNTFLEKITPSASKVVPEIKLHSKSMSRILLYHFISHDVCLFYLFENLRVRTFRKRSTQRQKTGYTKVYQVGRQRLWLINWVIFLQIGGRRKNRKKYQFYFLRKCHCPLERKKVQKIANEGKKGTNGYSTLQKKITRDKWVEQTAK